MEIAHKKWETDLIEACKKGERKAQKQLYEHFHGLMLAICMRYGKNREEALEIMNSGFLKVFRNIDKFTATGSFEGWIKRIMVNTGIDHYRKHGGAIRKIEEVQVNYEVNIIDQNHAISNLGAQEILNLIQKLPPSYRTIFSLYVLEGFGHKEIAEKLGISIGTSKSSLSKARVKLQEMLSKLHSFKTTGYGKE